VIVKSRFCCKTPLFFQVQFFFRRRFSTVGWKIVMEPERRSFSKLLFGYGLSFCCFYPSFSPLTDLRDTLHPRRYFLDFPPHEVNPAFHITGRSNEIVLQGHLLQSSIPGSTYSMGSD